MEAVPRMPMLAFDLKNCPETVDIAPALKTYISEFYHENPESYNKECNDLEQLRRTAVQVSRDFVGCSTLKKYYCQLLFLRSRFPLGPDDLAVPFTWEDAHSGRPVTVADVHFEEASILYNIGSLHSILGSLDNRQTPEGMKVSCTHFQCASWAYEHLRDNYTLTHSPDTNYDFLTFHIKLMLAQAQECILEKSMADNRKSNITAKVAAQIVDFYQQALRSLDASGPSNIVGSRKYKEWKRRMELKQVYHTCVMNLYLSNQSEEQQSWGERLAYLTVAQDRLKDALKLAKSDGDKEIEDALVFTMDIVVGKYNSAKKDNDLVYNDKVPALDSLPEVKGASLVKGIPFNPQDPEVSGQDIFHKLVPMAAHEASSLYSEEKAKLLRNVGGRIEQANQALSQFMDSLQLDSAQLDPGPERIPQTLLEKCAALSVKPDTIKQLIASMQALSHVATDVEGNIHEIISLTSQEAQSEAEFQKACGKRTANVTVSELEKECEKYQEGLIKASQSNEELHKAMNTHVTNLRLLSGPLEDLQQSLPHVNTPLASEDQSVVDNMRRLLAKVEEMRTQRSSLESQLRENVVKDDITSTLVVKETDNQLEFFQTQLKKHDNLVSLLDQNIAAQSNILQALTQANAQYASIRRSQDDVKQRRAAAIDGLLQSCDVYEDLLAKSQKGVEFYQKLETNVTRLLERTRRVCKAQEEERAQIMERLKPKGPPPSRPSAPKPGQAAPTQIPQMTDPTLPPDLPTSAAPTLKDFLPFMKPGSWSKPGSNQGARSQAVDPTLLAQYPGLSVLSESADVPDSAQAVPQEPSSLDPNLLARYPGLSVLQNRDTSQITSLPGSHSSSPVHMPRQPHSQPNSPQLFPRYQANQGPTSVAPNLADMIQSPTAAPGAPSSRKWSPEGVGLQNGTPPGGPSVSGGQMTQRGPQSSGILPANHPSASSATYQPTPASQTSYLPASAYQIPTASQIPQQTPTASQIPQQPPTASQIPQQPPTASQIPQQPPTASQIPQQPPTASQISQQPPTASQIPQQPPTASKISQQPPTASQIPQQPPTASQISQQPPTASQIPQQPPTASQIPQQFSTASQLPQQRPTASQIPQQRPTVSQIPQQPPTASQIPQQPPTASQIPQQFSIASQLPQQPPTASQLPQQPPTASQIPQQPPTASQIPQQPPTASQIPQQTPTASQIPQQFSSASQLPQQPPTASRLPQQPPIASQIPQQPPTASQIPQQPPSASQIPQQFSTASQIPKQPPTTSQIPQQPHITSQTPYLSYASQNSYQPATSSQQSSAQHHPTSYQVSPRPQTTSQIAQQPQITSQVPQQPPITSQSSQRPPVASQIPQQPSIPSQMPSQSPIPSQHIPPNTAANQNQNNYSQQYSQTNLNYQTSQVHGHQPAQGQGYQHQQSQVLKTAQGQGHQPVQVQGHQPAQAQGHQPVQSQGYQPPKGQGYQPQQGQGFQPQQGQGHQPAPGQGYPQQGQGQPAQGQGYQPQQGRGHLPAQGHQPAQGQGYQPQQGQVYQPQQGQGHQLQQGQVPKPTQGQGHLPHGQISQPQGQGYPQGYQPQQGPGYHPQGHPTQQGQVNQHPQGQGYQPLQGQVMNQGQPQFQGQHQGFTSTGQRSQPASLPMTSTGHTVQNYQAPPSQPVNQYPYSQQSPQQIPGNLPSPLKPSVPESQPPPPSCVSPVPTNQQQQAAKAPEQTLSQVGDAVSGPGAVSVEKITERQSSVDDMLSVRGDTSKDVLRPKVITAEELQLQKEEEMKNSLKQTTRDPYADNVALQKFVSEVEKYDKLVDGLNRQTLNGPTPLEKEWKELLAAQDKFSRSTPSAIARCYPMKNSHPDIMPYDSARVVLTTTKDDYINATHIGDLSASCPKFITTQSPLSSTVNDFWAMVYEQGTEVIAMICRETEATQKNLTYWPVDKSHPLHFGPISVTLQSSKVKGSWEEHILTLNHSETRHTRSVVHLQFLEWPISGVPESPALFLHFISEVHSFYVQQRSLIKPLIVHCNSGVGRTGVFCVVYAGVAQVNQGQGLINVTEVVSLLRQRRRWMIQTSEQLLFCYHAVLYHAQQLLMKRGILTHHASFGDKLPAPGSQRHQRKPSDDFILGGATSLSTLQSSVSKMTATKPPPETTTKPTETTQEEGSQDKTEPSVENGNSPENGFIPLETRSRSASGSSVVSQTSVTTQGPENQRSDSTDGAGVSLTNLPPALANLQNPNTFHLEATPPSKRKITKASFANQSGGITEVTDPCDPLNSLDPLWNIKASQK